MTAGELYTSFDNTALDMFRVIPGRSTKKRKHAVYVFTSFVHPELSTGAAAAFHDCTTRWRRHGDEDWRYIVSPV